MCSHKTSSHQIQLLKKSLYREKVGKKKTLQTLPTQESPSSFLKTYGVQKTLFSYHYQIKLIYKLFNIMHFSIHTDFVLSETKSIEKPMSIKNNLLLT